jgi:hypothetical protein
MMSQFLRYARIESHPQPRMDEAELTSALSAHYASAPLAYVMYRHDTGRGNFS